MEALINETISWSSSCRTESQKTKAVMNTTRYLINHFTLVNNLLVISPRSVIDRSTPLSVMSLTVEGQKKALTDSSLKLCKNDIGDQHACVSYTVCSTSVKAFNFF